MVQLVKMAGLDIAESVYTEMKELLVDWKEEGHILTYGFANYKCTGYHFSANRRGVTVINNSVTDEIRLVFGDSSQFDTNTNVAKHDTGYTDIHPDDVQKAAKLVIGWLLRGAPPYVF